MECVGISAGRTASDKAMRESGTSIFATHLVYSLIIFMVQIDQKHTFYPENQVSNLSEDQSRSG